MSPQRRRSSTRSSPRRKAAPRRDFWDGAGGGDEPVALVRSPEDPAAMVRSLGPPPLPGRETIAEHYFAAAYDKAARRARALAAANGLLDLSEPED
jgi:hypothetical protein